MIARLLLIAALPLCAQNPSSSDTLVPPSVSASYLRSRGPSDASCRLEILAACDHFGIIGPGHTAYGRVTAAINEVSTAAPAGAGPRA